MAMRQLTHADVVVRARGALVPLLPLVLLMPYAIALLAFCFAAGLLLAATAALSLAWLPGQLPIMLALCYVIPLLAVFARRHRSILQQSAATRFGGGVLAARLALFALVLAGLPLLEWAILSPGADKESHALFLPVLAALIAGQVAWRHATALFDLWQGLRARDWEEDTTLLPGDPPSRRAARVDRTDTMGQLWLSIIVRGVLLCVALTGAIVVNAHGTPPPPAGAALLVAVYVLTGLLIGGGAARQRLVAESRLDGLPLSDTVIRSWLPTTAIAIGGVAALMVLALVAHVLDIAHATIAWLWETVLQPAGAATLGLFGHGTTGNDGGSGTTGAQSVPAQTYPPLATTAPASITSPSTSVPLPNTQGFDRLMGVLTYVVAHVALVIVFTLLILAAAVLLRACLEYGTRFVPDRPRWPQFLAAARGEWRRLRRIVLKPAHAAAGALIRRSAADALERRRRARARQDIRPEWLAPRALVLYLYAQALGVLTRKVQPRRPGQAPGEYAAEVGERLGLRDRAAFDSLTADFLEARYGPRAVEPGLAARAHASWNTLLAALKRTRQV